MTFMKQTLGVIGSTAIVLLSIAAAVAQPVNNNFVDAITLVGPIVTATGSNVGANRQGGFFGGEPNHGGNRGGASVWWNWTATASGQTTIDTMGMLL